MMWAAVELAAELNFGKVEEDGEKKKKMDFVCFCVCVYAAHMNSIAAHLRS